MTLIDAEYVAVIERELRGDTANPTASDKPDGVDNS